ncbi:hypothetical protein R3P38DRAFT_2768125 [Favolaschia claudopus]|uniref:Uncharacterized protein n=1 Tax=Favolaschia claudopus TaxID=2862362 RepID=A0AAW0CUN6_9AGAR
MLKTHQSNILLAGHQYVAAIPRAAARRSWVAEDVEGKAKLGILKKPYTQDLYAAARCWGRRETTLKAFERWLSLERRIGLPAAKMRSELLNQFGVGTLTKASRRVELSQRTDVESGLRAAERIVSTQVQARVERNLHAELGSLGLKEPVDSSGFEERRLGEDVEWRSWWERRARGEKRRRKDGDGEGEGNGERTEASWISGGGNKRGCCGAVIWSTRGESIIQQNNHTYPSHQPWPQNFRRLIASENSRVAWQILKSGDVSVRQLSSQQDSVWYLNGNWIDYFKTQLPDSAVDYREGGWRTSAIRSDILYASMARFCAEVEVLNSTRLSKIGKETE